MQSYLAERSSNAILSDTEKSSISTSILTLETRLNTYFGDQISKQLQFGSSTRGTILPRSMDSNSDIDYMIVFKDEELRPQTYIDKLRRFANHYYTNSNIAQSHPTVVLELNHIKFDLVPAIKSYMEEYRIPAPSSSYAEWLATAPTAFNTTLTTANTQSNYKLKPAIRLLKFWNAQAGYVFDSYSLEQWAAARYYFLCTTVKDYLFSMIEGLNLDWDAAQWRKDKLNRAKKIVADTKEYEANSMPYTAEDEIKKLIPA
ncbi:SMODS domain-containing nucleotidyltransferase [Shewanella carassii]|uniref:SMODS domain-containing nucleotidyltransferase n=1 Tax=Shewanella carassii TaxID=1987584 RepID=UPI001E506C8E|nr:nucleotidyltransferase domain-containing protein [Shewanella carassii]